MAQPEPVLQPVLERLLELVVAEDCLSLGPLDNLFITLRFNCTMATAVI
jgi:hypothetical protein